MPRNQPLVLEHLENISRAALEKYEHIIRDIVRNRHGVYALYRRGRLYYVGLAGNLRNRLRTHLRDRHGKSWDRFAIYLTVDNRHMKELESLILRIVRPPGNRVVGRFAQSENVLRRFRREIKDYVLREIDDVVGRRRLRLRVRSGGKSLSARNKPDLANCFRRATSLRAQFKGTRVVARVRKHGTIHYSGKSFLSVSAAARAVRRCPTNGWTFWRVRNTSGHWVRLRDAVSR